MKRTINAMFDGEVLRPEEVLDLEPNSVYRVTIDEQIPVQRPSGPGALDDVVALAADLDLPPDFADQHDHYLYGSPRR